MMPPIPNRTTGQSVARIVVVERAARHLDGRGRYPSGLALRITCGRRLLCARRLVEIVACLVLMFFAESALGSSKNPPHAKLKVSGCGFLGNIQMTRQIRLMELQKAKPEFFGADMVEDSLLILFGRLESDGYLNPEITVALTLADGSRTNYVRTEPDQEPLPRTLRARVVEFKIRKGVLYHYDELKFEGLDAISEGDARRFFMDTSGVLKLKRYRVYAPGRLQRSLRNLGEIVQRSGYQDAEVRAEGLTRNDQTGGVRATIRVEKGLKYVVRQVRQEALFEGTTNVTDLRTNLLLRPYSKFWEQDYIQAIKTNYFRRGYPQTAVTMQTTHRELSPGSILLDMEAVVKPGPRVLVGKVRFEGNMRTQESLMKKRAPVENMLWLDPMKAEEGRYRLSRLGAFDYVELRYKPEQDRTNVWDVIYHVKEGREVDVHLLFGFGSYDLLRGGIEMDQYNLWGLAHNTRLRLVQSFKSSSADYFYTVPELLGLDEDFFLNASWLRREEVSFVRLEYGGGAGVRRMFRRIDTETTLRYNYGLMEAAETSGDFSTIGAINPTVGEFILDVRHDRRDNALYPHNGYQLLGNFELANRYFGGDVNYERLEIGGSYHRALTDSFWVHLGAKHGILATIGGTIDDLPFTKRFFPGGENSIRGYQEGEAGSKNAAGKVIGSETYFEGNVELEQAITPKWSVVGFVDGVEIAQSMDDYPGTEALFSAGGGIRLRTIVGPVRLEYGHNLNPRPGDPSGTVQFSLGFPF